MPKLFPGIKNAQKEFSQIGEWMYNEKIDIFLLETMNNISETEYCIQSIEKFNIPIWVSFNLLDSSHIKSGESLKMAIKMVKKYSVNCLLLNCNPLDSTIQASKLIKENWNKNWGVYPNLGLGAPPSDGIINVLNTDNEFQKSMYEIVNLGADIIGGCCGCNPKHIQKLNSLFIDK